MAFWFWVVVLSIIGLGIYELYSWYKFKKNPPAAEVVVDEEPVTIVQAELARANMKIAMLESRLEESEAQRNKEADALIALDERYQKQIEQTEKAYQRQMVNLSERLSANGGSGAKKNVDEYPVRMAAEVAAWRASLGGHALVEPVISEDLAALADNMNESIDAQNYAPDAISEETADPKNGAAPAAEVLESAPESVPEVEPDLAEMVVLAEAPEAPEKEILDQVVMMAEVPAAPIEADPEAVEERAGSDIKRLTMPEGVEDASDEAPEADAAVEEIPPLENRWPDLESAAMQRVVARHLASEMDADYLDDEEFLREMGIEPELNDPQLPTVAEGWVTDPLQEMNQHINGQTQPFPVEPQPELQTSDLPDHQTQKITDDMWEEVVFSSADSVNEIGGDEAVEPLEYDLENKTGNGAEARAQATEELDPEAEEAAIAAAVETILSRTPQPPQAASGTEEIEEPDPALPGVDLQSELPEKAVEYVSGPQDYMDEDDEEAAFVWEREPVKWQAEYYDNRTLAEKPVIIRQEDEIDFEWLDKPPAKGIDPQTFSVRWSGTLSLDPGQYRFLASAPDGLRLWLNDRLVISAWYDQSEQIYQRDFAWPGGTIDVRLEHYENGGNAKAFLTWDRIA
jgi:hypothetical protein